MKAKALCLLAFLGAINAQTANWAGTWYNDVTRDNICCPAGLMTITQDDTGKTTVKGKWDEYSSKCKAFKLNDQKIERDGDVAVDKQLVMQFDAPTGEKLTITLVRTDADNSQITCLNQLGPSVTGGLYQKKDDTKFQEYVGTYSVNVVEGTSDRCCFPETFEVKAPEDAVYVANIKWKDTQGCKDVLLNDQKWENAHLRVIPSPLSWEQERVAENGTLITHAVKKLDNGTLNYYNVFSNPLVCNAHLETKKEDGGDNKWWIWLIIGLIALAVVIIAVVSTVVYNKKKKAKAAGAPDNEYGRMVTA